MSTTRRVGRVTRGFCVYANHENMIVSQFDLFLVQHLKMVSKSIQNDIPITARCVRLYERHVQIGVLPRTLRSNDQDPAILVSFTNCISRLNLLIAEFYLSDFPKKKKTIADIQIAFKKQFIDKRVKIIIPKIRFFFKGNQHILFSKIAKILSK